MCGLASMYHGWHAVGARVKAATTTIPIIFSTASNPVAEGLVAKRDHLGTELVQKQVDMLHQMVPKATVIAALVNPTDPALAGPATKDGFPLDPRHPRYGGGGRAFLRASE